MCILRVTGRQFDIDRHLTASGLTADVVFRAGEPRRKSKPDGERHQRSGFTDEVSPGPWVSPDEQTPDAIHFLRQHETALTTLRVAPGIEDMRLDFRIDL